MWLRMRCYVMAAFSRLYYLDKVATSCLVEKVKADHDISCTEIYILALPNRDLGQPLFPLTSVVTTNLLGARVRTLHKWINHNQDDLH